MNPRGIEFLVDRSGKSPKNLKESIRKVSDASAGFIQSWQDGSTDDAHKTSQEAFEHLDYIQNELLRQRDVHSKQDTWSKSPFKAALDEKIGSILINIPEDDRSWFLNLQSGDGAFPLGSNLTPLTLETALNKLKHHDPRGINFVISPIKEHNLFIFTNGGNGQPNSISTFNVLEFCKACKAAALHV